MSDSSTVPSQGKWALNLQRAVERVILASRFLLIVFYVGLAIALATFAFAFVLKLGKMVLESVYMDEMEILMAMLVLIDKALVASLIVMVMLSSYENFVGRFEDAMREDSPSWLGRLDPGNLKIKVAATIIAISSINLLQGFMQTETQTDRELMWKAVIHGVFLASALVLAIIDKITSHGSAKAAH